MKKIKEQNLFVPYNLCLKMRDLGFDWGTFDCYWEHEKGTSGFGTRHEKVPKILYDQAFAWFRKKGFECNIKTCYDYVLKLIGYLYSIEFNENNMHAYIFYDDVCFEIYEECRLDALNKLIELYERENSKKL